MDIEGILSRIQQDDITIIQEEVRVQFDNYQQTPLGFQWRNKNYEVMEPLSVSKGFAGYMHYLVITNGGIFNLTLVRDKEGLPLCTSRWVLQYRVNDDPFQKKSTGKVIPFSGRPAGKAVSFHYGASKLILVPPLLSNIVYYHGHLCPELAIGYRAGLLARQELGLSRENAHNFFVLAENMTSSIDALQLITGCTIGNQKFFAYDLGKHVYYFGCFLPGSQPQEALRLALINPVVDLGHKSEVGEKIAAGRTGAAEVAAYQQAVDESVRQILDFSDDSLFARSKVFLRAPRVNDRRAYVKCSCCGEVVAVEKTVAGGDELLCQVCGAKKM